MASVGLFFGSDTGNTEAVAKMIEKTGKDIRLEVDGGIIPENAGAVISAGANALVAGSAVFGKGAANYASAITAIRNAKPRG